MVCQFYKQGHCEKGKRCKFSHDLAVERRGEKKSVYTDMREGEKEGEDEKKRDDMGDWDEGEYISILKRGCGIGEAERGLVFVVGLK